MTTFSKYNILMEYRHENFPDKKISIEAQENKRVFLSNSEVNAVEGELEVTVLSYHYCNFSAFVIRIKKALNIRLY